MDKNCANPAGYIYGPVPSRRLGLSLGIDIVPSKICTLDCVYCQIGRTTEKSTVRRGFFDLPAVLDELKVRLAEGGSIDYITIGGSGEPTLNSQLGALIDGIRSLTAIPVAIITNGTLLYRPDVRAECGKANLVIPSLDAGDATTFGAVNRPAPDINIEKLVSGLALFREEFSGQIWLEVFLIEGGQHDARADRENRGSRPGHPAGQGPAQQRGAPGGGERNRGDQPGATGSHCPTDRRQLRDYRRRA